MKKQYLTAEGLPSYLCPLFWQHGESAEKLREEIEKMDESGIGSFIVEARPHPDFLSFGWWRDLDIIIAEAKSRDMQVYLFDDSAYPSGFGDGKIKQLYPEYRKLYMGEHHIDAVGPMKGSYINVGAWLNREDKLLRVIVGKRGEGSEALVEESLMDITSYVKEGRLYWDIPDGEYRIFIIYSTREGGEDWTKDYVNPIDSDAVRKYIDIIYEEHFKRYKSEFGKTIQGFFVDEPRFGSASGYEVLPGEAGKVLPYCQGLLELLDAELSEKCDVYLPLLFSKENSRCSDVHYAYMNVVSKLFGEAFIGQIGEWCREHNVKVIGHVVEDNGAHARLGYGSGHFYRSMEGFSTSGLDVVYQIWPEYLEGRHLTPFGYLNSEFFYWGLAKMASSAAHLDPKKDGVTICEAFGAYGWQEGLKLMKWLTDHLCVRGINQIVPHAFSPKFPDEDCPPHFYAGGNNPQWKYFSYWSSYANRVCHLLSGGIHKATAAVLYHAEAEWGGTYEPFEKAVRVLMSNQIDCDVIPCDIIADRQKAICTDGKLTINQESYEILIIPYAKQLPLEIIRRVLEMSEQQLPVVFLNQRPERPYYQSCDTEEMSSLHQSESIRVVATEELADYLLSRNLWDVKSEHKSRYLTSCHYLRGEQNIYYFINSGKREYIDSMITIHTKEKLVFYDAMRNEYYPVEQQEKAEGSQFRLILAPYQSLFAIEMEEGSYQLSERIPVFIRGKEQKLDNSWNMYIEDKDEQTIGKLLNCHTLENMANSELVPSFSGTIIYEYDLEVQAEELNQKVYLDLGEVYESSKVTLNEKMMGVCICPPYTYELTGLLVGQNKLRIEVTNTYAKEKGDNIFDRAMPQEPTGLLGPVRIVWA